MTIKGIPFRATKLDEERDKSSITISLKLNLEEQTQLVKAQQVLNQQKVGTAVKQLMKIGTKVILDDYIGEYVEIVMSNKRRNKRLGIVDYE